MKKFYVVMMALITVTVMQAQMTFTELNDKNGDAVENPYYFTEYNGKVYFQADGPYGQELYVTDGTQAGTEVIDVYPGTYTQTENIYDENWNVIGTEEVTYQNSSTPGGLIVYDGELYFNAYNDGNHGQYKYNSTTNEVTAVDATTPFYNPMIKGDNIYYINEIAWDNKVLYMYNGSTSAAVPSTGQTHLVENKRAIIYNESILFYGDVDGSDADYGMQLCMYDITNQTFSFLKNVEENDNGRGGWLDANISNFTLLNGKVYFSGEDWPTYLWETNGTTDGTVKVDVTSGISKAKNYYVWNNELYFNGTEAGSDLYKYNGTNVQNISQMGDVISPIDHEPSTYCVYGGSMYYIGYAEGYAKGMYSTDGSSITLQNTNLVYFGGAMGTISNLLLFNGMLDSNASNTSLMLYDPTPTAIGDELDTNTITVSPNPSNGMVTVNGLESAAATYAIYNLSGKCVEKGLIGSSNQIDYNVNAGVYLLNIVDAGNSKVIKIVVR